MITTGTFYKTLKERNSYSLETSNCIENVVNKLIDINTSLNKPAMLLGKIQSGKTKTFLGIIGLVFDNEYELVVILTKGTKALTSQTIQRLEQEFQIFEDQDNLQIFDIMNLPTNLTPFELSQKIIIVSKKMFT